MTLPFRRTLTAHAAAVIVAATVVIASPQPAQAAASCEVTYQKSWDNGSGFGANITIRNTGDPIANWTLTFTFPGDQRITNGWSADWRQDGPNVTATSMPWNGNLGMAGSTGIGFNGTHGSQGNTDPIDFAINGVPCNGRPQPPAPIVSPTSVFPPEGGSADVSVRLSAPPTANVTFNNFSGPGDFDITICVGATLVFTPANWNVPQLVRICAADDEEFGNGVRFFLVAGVSVSAVEVDNDQAPTKVDDPFSAATGR